MIKTPLNLAMLGDQAAEQFCDILGLADTFSPLADDGCIPSPSFSYFSYDAATYELSDALSSGRVAVINVPDADGVYRQVATTKVAYVGARHSGGKQYADNGSGVLLDPQPYALSAPEATSVRRYSSAYNSWITGGSPSFASATDLWGEANPVGKVIDNNADGSAAIIKISWAHVSGISYVHRFWILKEDDETSFPDFDCTSSLRVRINKKTGAIAYRANTVPVTNEATVVDLGDMWLLMLRVIATATAEQDTYIVPAITNVWGTNLVNEATGSVTILHTDLLSGVTTAQALITPPIRTTTAAVTRDKDVIAAPLANLNQPSNSGYIEVNIATGSTPNILGAFLSFDGTSYKLFDGTTTISVAGTVGAHKLGWYAGPGGMNLCVDGTWGTEAAYDGTLAASLGVFTDATYVQGIRNWKLWDVSSKAAVDAEMAA